MMFFSDETRQARAALIAAHQDLDAVDAEHKDCADECEDYLAANQAVIDAEKDLPWWKRADISLGCYPPPEPGHVRGTQPPQAVDQQDAARADDDTDVDG